MRHKEDVSEWQDIGDIFTPEGRRAMSVGQVLIFGGTDGKERHFKVMKRTVKRIWVKEITLLRPEEVIVEEKSSK